MQLVVVVVIIIAIGFGKAVLGDRGYKRDK
jgi:hypothetical protein